MAPNIQIPLLWIVLFLLALGVTSILCGIGIYYLISKRFKIASLIISAFLLLGIASFIFLKREFDSVGTNLIIWGFPFSLLGELFPFEGLMLYLSYLIAITINYLVLFGMVNFAHRLLTKQNS
jgi:hypothetical protein